MNRSCARWRGLDTDAGAPGELPDRKRARSLRRLTDAHDAAAIPAEVAPVPRYGVKTAKALVLLVDDNVDNRELYAEFLVYSGFEVVQACFCVHLRRGDP